MCNRIFVKLVIKIHTRIENVVSIIDSSIIKLSKKIRLRKIIFKAIKIMVVDSNKD